MMFAHRLLLLATPRQIGVLDWRPGHLHWLGEFSTSAEGIAGFRQVVLRHRHLPALVVADTVDEDYRSEILPHVQGRARDALLTRKLKQVFRNARFTGAWRQAREHTGRRDDRYLLAAMTDAEWLMPWISVLLQENAPLIGVTPLAMASQYLLPRLHVSEPHVLLACRFNNGLRLSYYQDGQLRFSRLIGSDTPTQFSGNAAEEIAKTQLYLTGQRILPREARLHVLLLDPAGRLDSAQAQLNADPAFSTRLVDMVSLARSLHIPEDFLATTPDMAMLAAVGGETPSLNLAPADLLKRHLEFQWRRGLHLAAASVAVVGIAGSVAYSLHAQALRDEARVIQTQSLRADQQHRAIVSRFPALATRPDQLGQTLTLATRLNAAPLDIAALFVPLGQALSAHPDVVLKQVAFNDLGQGSASLRIDAHLARFDGNYRAAMARIDRFAARLASTPGVTGVERLDNPVNTAPTATLTGTTTGETSPDETRFSLSVQVRPS